MKYKNSHPIAILLAAYNAEKYLGEQLDSLFNQTNQDWALYIRNDASTDNTQKVIDSYCNKHSDKIFQVDKGGKNLGCGCNFYKLLESVESDYYMFCDADDYWVADKTEISIKLLKEKELLYPNLPIIVFGDNSICDENLNIIEESWWRAQKLKPQMFLGQLTIALHNVVGGAAAMFNAQVKQRCLPIPENPPLHDIWIAMQTSKYGKMFIIDKPLKLYRQHASNVIGAPVEPYQFYWRKLAQIPTIIKRDYQMSKYFKGIGYGSTAKYFFARVVIFFKLQWGKITY